VQLLADEAAASNKQVFPFWDFSAINTFTTETIPSKGDRKTSMHWYWEAGHFKSDLGNLMLDRMLGQTGQPADFGVLLTPANVPAQNATVQAQELVYRRTHAAEIDEIIKFAAKKTTNQ